MPTVHDLRHPGAAPGATAVGKKKGEPNNRQINVRLNEDDFGRLKAASETLGIDMAQLIRSFIKKQLPHIEREAGEIHQNERTEGD